MTTNKEKRAALEAAGVDVPSKANKAKLDELLAEIAGPDTAVSSGPAPRPKHLTRREQRDRVHGSHRRGH